MSAALVKLQVWFMARMARPRCPVPMSALVRGHLAQSPLVSLLIFAVAVALFAVAVRSAWWEIYGRWYRRWA